MSPLELIRLWRERWGKADPRSAPSPYRSGWISHWGDKLGLFPVWGIPGLSAVPLLVFLVFTVIMTGVQFDLKGQWMVSVAILMVSLAIQLYQGTLVTLMLLGFALISSARYGYWRLTATLQPEFNLEFLLALGLFCAEVYACLLIVLSTLTRAWPAVSLPVPRQAAPTEALQLDVLIVASTASSEAITNTLTSITRCSGAHYQFAFHVLDQENRDQIREHAHHLGVDFVSSDSQPCDVKELINLVLSRSTHRFAVVVEAGNVLAPDFLARTFGWFETDPDLGLLATPRHFVLPAPSDLVAQQFSDCALGGSFLIMRRSALIQSGGMPLEPASREVNLGTMMSERGFRHAYVAENNATLVRVNDPLLESHLRNKLAIARWQQVVHRACPVLVWIGMLAPLLYFFARFNLIKTTVPVYLAYAIPHCLQAFVLQNRITSAHWSSLWISVREALFALYLLVATAVLLVWTQWRMRRSVSKMPRPSDEWKTSRWPVVLIGLHLIAFGMVLWQRFHGKADVSGMQWLYMAWSAMVILTLAARLAVAEEARQIQQQKLRLMTLPVMLKLSNNHTSTGVTLNFPSPTLELQLPRPVTLQPDTEIFLSLFFADREASFKALITKANAEKLQVSILEEDQVAYVALGQLVFARDSDWPDWLPGHDADKLFAPWFAAKIRRVFPAMPRWSLPPLRHSFKTLFGNRKRENLP